MLSEEAKTAMERLRISRDQNDLFQYESDTCFMHDVCIVTNQMLNRLYPVRTLNGMVIRWDDEITPERLVACGGETAQSTTSKAMLIDIGGKLWAVCQAGEICWLLNGVVIQMEPRNMGEVWGLMERCGIEVSGE